MFTKRFQIILLITIMCSAVLQAQGNLGQSGANFLQISVDPRGTALGGAASALAEGTSALYWNPAGLAEIQHTEIQFTQTDWFVDTRLFFGAIARKIGGLGRMGISVTSFFMDEMEVTHPYFSEGTGQTYDAGDLAIGISFARAITDFFDFGFTVKYIYEFIWNETADQVAFDVGGIYRAPNFYNLRIGMTIRNVGGKMKFTGEDIDKRLEEEFNSGENPDTNPRLERLTPEFRLPQQLFLSIAFEPFTMERSHITVLTGVEVPSDNEQRLNLGVEYSFLNQVFFRVSYRHNYDLGKFAVGGGIRIKLLGLNSFWDYAYIENDAFGGIQQFGIRFVYK